MARTTEARSMDRPAIRFGIFRCRFANSVAQRRPENRSRLVYHDPLLGSLPILRTRRRRTLGPVEASDQNANRTNGRPVAGWDDFLFNGHVYVFEYEQ
jgi:hypothetical protein